MSSSILIAPSILSADFARLAEAAAAVAAGGADMLHVDVMDGHFVPNLTIGPPVVASLAKATTLPLDCHLMVENPDPLLPEFAKAGARWLSVHWEACRHLDRTIALIRSLGMQPGVAINPHTPVELLLPVLPDLDFVLLMSVNPGFGGQRFLPRTLDKARWLDAWQREHGASLAVEIDGGITRETIGDARAAGVDWFVAGSAVFGAAEVATAITGLRQAAERAK